MFAYSLKDWNMDYSKLKKVYKVDVGNSPLSIAFSKKTSDSLVNKFKKAFETIKKKGTIDTIRQKWFGETNLR